MAVQMYVYFNPIMVETAFSISFCNQWIASEKCSLVTVAYCGSQFMEFKFEGVLNF